MLSSGQDFGKTKLDLKHVLRVYFKPCRKNQDFGFLPLPSKPVWLKNRYLSSLLSGTRHSPAIHVHGDYDHDKGIERIKNILGDEKSSQWFEDGEHENHVGIVNVWRPLDYPVEKCPLGHVDIDTIR